MLDPRASESVELEVLLEAASAGDESAWRELIVRYARRVFALAKSRCRTEDAAEEVTQSVFATVAEKLGGGEYTERGRFESWLFRITMNRIRDRVRTARRRADLADPELIRNVPAAEEREPPMLGMLRSAMQTLNEADREVVQLRHYGQMSFRQMSDLLGEPVGTLLARHHRALRKLRRAMTDTGDGPDQGGMT